jgi:hypothetical protein
VAGLQIASRGRDGAEVREERGEPFAKRGPRADPACQLAVGALLMCDRQREGTEHNAANPKSDNQLGKREPMSA